MDEPELYPEWHKQERKAFLSQMEEYLDRNELQAALDLAQARLKRTPEDLDARVGICRVRILQERIEEAGEMIQEMEEILASLAQIYVCMGNVFMKKGMEDSAETYYRKYMALNPAAPRVRDIMAKKGKGIEERQGTDAQEETEGATEGNAGIPSDFQTVTLAELYIRQGHLRPAEEVLEKIIGQEPQNEKAAELLREVRGLILREAFVQQNAGVVAELSRWLDNIAGLRGHAA
jgi:tetratricopeptide (TPR) repeat protein